MSPSGHVYNGTLSAGSAGTARVRVTEISQPLDIIASADSQARSRRAFYPASVDKHTFMITLAFTSWSDRENFNIWMANFMTKISEGQSSTAVMMVRVPARGFARAGLPQGNVDYGEGVTDVGYQVRLTFLSATNAINYNVKTYLKNSTNLDIKKFYPSGDQISGVSKADSVIFDGPAHDAAAVADAATPGDSAPPPPPAPVLHLTPHPQGAGY